MVDLNQKGEVLPEEISTSIGVVRCPECHHEFVKTYDESEFIIKDINGFPVQIFLQILGNIMVGVALFFSNKYLLPDNAFSHPMGVIYSVFLLLPSFILWLVLFAVQYMGLIRVWFFLVVGLVILSFFISGGMAFVDFVQEYQS